MTQISYIFVWLGRCFLERLMVLKQAFSPEILHCVCKGGHVESGARVFTYHTGSIKIGNKVKIGRGSVISNYDKNGAVDIGDGTAIGWYNNFYCQGGLSIGKNVLFASNVCILTSNHGWKDASTPIMCQHSSCKGVRIGDDSWIGYNAIILPGVNIGCHVVIGAGSVVTKDMPDYAVCAGNPCRVIHMIKEGSAK